ncbi:MAG: hypothetical protein JWO05_1172 [Gemmatimonadetes bacterium]|nr:hypothetical protein [Gemmatimonadota bacterium]
MTRTAGSGTTTARARSYTPPAAALCVVSDAHPRRTGCGALLVTTLDAVQRERLRCPTCERTAKPRTLHPDELPTRQLPPAVSPVPPARFQRSALAPVSVRPAPVVEPVPRTIVRVFPDAPPARPLVPRPEATPRRVRGPRLERPVFKPKVCRDCHREFIPQGPRTLSCDPCRGVTR